MSNQSSSILSRRFFLCSVGAASVVATTLPAFASVQGSASRQPSRPAPKIDVPGIGLRLPSDLSDDLVAISMNENPLGPAQSVLDAIAQTAAIGNRYHGELVQATVNTAIDLYGMPRGTVGLFPGSTGALTLALMSHIGPGKPLVYADPSYELAPSVADMVGAPKFPTKLTSTYAHDVRAMVAASPKVGAYFIVNPNNPTGTITPKQDIVWLLKNKPTGSVVIVDEAYHHFSDAESCIDLVAAGQDIIVTRTFSKIYGMAGMRAGLVFARPEYFQKFRGVAPYAPSLASVSITTAAAVNAALADKDLVPLRRKINADIRSQTVEFLTKRGYTVIPGSQANFFMVDARRPGGDFQIAMAGENVLIGRSWTSMPTYVRVSVGTRDEMAKFQTAFVKCMDKPSSTANGAASLHNPALIPSELNRYQSC